MWLIISIITIVLIIIITVILALEWKTLLSKEITIPPAQQYSYAGYGSRCNPTTSSVSAIDANPISFKPQICDSGLVCVTFPELSTQYGLCMRDIGAPCNNLYECAPGTLMCDKVCTSSPGGLGMRPIYNPLTHTYVCNSSTLSVSNISGRCEYIDGFLNGCNYPNYSGCVITGATGCLQDTDCANKGSGSTCQLLPAETLGQGSAVSANTKYCQSSMPNGSWCLNNAGCDSGNCSLGYCQPPGINTYTSIGAYCASHSPGCTSTTDSIPVPLVCNNEFTGVIAPLGTCQPYSQIWPSTTCSQFFGCLPPSICYTFNNQLPSQGNCVMPRVKNGLLLTDAPNTNDCSLTGLCTNGYTCTLASTCTPNSGSGVPSVGGTYGLTEWIPSSNGIFGYWRKKCNLPSGISTNGLLTSYFSNGVSTYLYATGTNTFGITGGLINAYIITGACTQITLNINFNATLAGDASLNVKFNAIKFTTQGHIMTWLTLNWNQTGSKTVTTTVNGKTTSTIVTQIFTYSSEYIDIQNPTTNSNYTITIPLHSENGNTSQSPFTFSGNYPRLVTYTGNTPSGILNITLDDYLISGNYRITYQCNGYILIGNYSATNVILTRYNVNSSLIIPFTHKSSSNTDDGSSYLYINPQFQIGFSVDNVNQSLTIPPTWEDNETYTYIVKRVGFTYANGSINQATVGYTVFKNNTYFLRLYNDGNDVALPGYFSSVSIPSVAIDLNLYNVTQSSDFFAASYSIVKLGVITFLS